MEVPAGIAFFAIVILIAVGIRLMAGSLDDGRVREYIRRRGGEIIDMQWSPFGRGWFGEKNDRIYEVRYRDQSGRTHRATVKTSMFSGVYFTEDNIDSDFADKVGPSRDLEWENAQLRQRIAELEERARR
jgi:hypothetical protein